MISRVSAVAAILSLGVAWPDPPAPGPQPRGPTILRFVDGVDQAARPMPEAEVTSLLNDPWATLVLRKGKFPASLDEALAALDQPDPAKGHPTQKSFFVSESGHLPIDLKLTRNFRMVITRTRPADPSSVVLISAPAGDREGF